MRASFKAPRSSNLRLISTIVALAALLLFVGVAPSASAGSAHDPCPMAQSPNCTDMAADPCCDHGQPDLGKDCKSGMSCQASVAAPLLPTEVAAEVVVVFVHADVAHGVARAPTSHPPDRTLRPPILR